MEKISRNLGPKFRKIRKSKKLTMKQISGEIISKSSLSRWERGEQDISLATFYKLLDEIHVFSEEASSKELIQFISKVSDLYRKDEIKQLKNISQALLKQYAKDRSYETLIKVTTVCDLYMDLSDEDLTDTKFKHILTLQVCRIKTWYKQDLFLFANSQFFLESPVIYKKAYSLIEAVYNMTVVPDLESRALLNAVFVLLKKKDLTHAETLLNSIKELNFSSSNLGAVYRENYFSEVIRYIKTGNSYGVEQCIARLGNSKMEKQLAKDSKFSLSQIKKIYKL
ncbi:Rgg/GadR/MutR family transcriptional regulator [Lactobacillus sp.]|uniref:helix-turn-helix domain-containing protein n=1 Tax=Lactobacillus sp. TaxID=1591 RepID=UPI0019AABFFF|nr:Rgg/GadR/MutR family transcriptional regulator [Lactobacillus sp.]MBD5429939.1 helix-turn-helix domain-containing protein [Lactobacillus sp.]